MNYTRLPYIDNTKAILVTAAVNLGVVFLYNWPGGITYAGVFWDSLICGCITTAIDMCIVHVSLKRRRAEGGVSAQVPVSRLIQKLPKNPFALGVIYACVFGVLIAAINAVILWFFGIQSMTFWPWMVYKLVYATLLSAKIVEYCIFRYVQPDCTCLEGAADNRSIQDPVKNPLPKVSVFKEMFGSVTVNIALNFMIGTALGGVVLGADKSVIIYPTTVEAIPITGLIFGFISGTLVTNGVVNGVNTGIQASACDISSVEAMVSNKRYTWMPKRKPALICFICACTMVFSAFALWGIMKLFGISIMNFYQFTVFITIYAAVISKPLSHILLQRCSQPDYIRYTLGIVNR